MKAHVKEGKPDARAHHGRSPVPVIPREDPVAVMVGDVAEGFCRNPGLVSIPVGPAAHGERRPAYNYSRPPEPPLRTLIGNPLPTSVLFKGIRLVLETGRQILD